MRGRTPPHDEIIADDDLEAFDQAMRDVRPLKRRSGPGIRVTPTGERSSQPLVLSASADLSVTRAGEEVTAFRPGLKLKQRRALQRGELPPDAELDLHGATAPQAETRLSSWVRSCLTDGRRCVRVVCGRGLHSEGTPILRERVIALLSTTPLAENVLGFASAPPSLGGTGAILVLLRRR